MTDHPMPMWARLLILFVATPLVVVIVNPDLVAGVDWELFFTQLFGG